MTRREAKAIAKEYTNFLHFHPNASEEAWKVYKKAHPKVLDSVFEEGPAALMELKMPEEQGEHEKKEHEHPQSRVLEQLQALTMSPLGLLHKSQSLEEDSAYNKVQDQLKRNYLKNRNKKRFDLEDKQDLDFLYGSIDDPTAESLETKARKAFTGDDAEIQISEKQKEKNLKNLKRYDKNKTKTHDSFDNDPYVWQTRSAIAEHGALREASLKKEYKKAGKKIDEKFDQDFKHTMERLKANTWKKFVEENPEKTAVYVEKESKKRAGKTPKKNAHEEDDFVDLQKAYTAWQEEVEKKKTQAIVPPTASLSPSSPDISAEVSVPVVADTTPPITIKSPEEQKLDAALAELKQQRAKNAEKAPAVQPTPPSSPPTTAPSTLAPTSPKPQPISPTNIPKPVITSSPPQQKKPLPLPQHTSISSIPSRPSQGQTRPGAAGIPWIRPRIPSQGMSRPGGDPNQQRRYSNPMVDMGRNFVQNRLSGMGQRMMGGMGKSAGQAAGNIAGNAAKRLAARVLMSPVVLFWIGVVILIIILLILLIALIVYLISGSETKTPSTIPGLTLSLVGPTQVQNSENIQYTINATYTGTAVITLSDPLPTETAFVSATGNFTNTNNTVAWKINDPDLAGNIATAAAGAGQSYSFTLILRPEKEDILVKNKIIATAIGGSGAGSGGGSEGPPLNGAAKDLEELIKGQGRNVTILGDENAFVAKVIQNGGAYGMAQKEQYLRSIYKAAVEWNVNPLVILGTWGTETGFRIDLAAKAFSCPVRVSSSFEAQALCSAKTYSKWMGVYESGQHTIDIVDKSGRKTGGVCTYTDPMMFAMEWYGPDCHVYDHNENYRPNMYKFIKTFSGI